MKHKADSFTQVKSYFHFVKAVNYYILDESLQNELFINDNCENFDNYKKTVLAENYDELIKKSGADKKLIEDFAIDFNKEMNAILIFSEKEVSANTSYELFNLAKITGKLGKTASGLLSIKEKNNSQGLFDMGITPEKGVGRQDIKSAEFINSLKEKWFIDELSEEVNDILELMNKGAVKNMFVFGEDPVGCAFDKMKVKDLISKSEFIVVQDYFITETAMEANLILPASMHFEIGGSFTNTQKRIQLFNKEIDSPIESTSCEQLIELLAKFGFNGINNAPDAMMEAFSLLPIKNKERKYKFNHNQDDNDNRMFDYGCDHVMKYFEESFTKSFE